MKTVLSLLKRYHIVTNLDPDMGNPDTRIQIYPSVILALDTNELNRVYEETKDKLDKYVNGGGSNNNADEEDTDET